MHPLIEGMILGLTLSIMLGPALFSLIQTSIHRGLYRGIILAIGIFLSDLSLVWLCNLGAAQVFGDNRNSILVGTIGGAILVAFGIVTYLRRVQLETDQLMDSIRKPGPMTYIVKGFLLNFANPFVWLFWVSVMVTVSASYGAGSFNVKLFFAGALLTVLITDFLKVVVAHQLKRYLKPRFIIAMNHVVGIMLVIFGVFLVIRTFINF